MSTQNHSPTDLTDRQWQRIAPLLPHPRQWEVGGGRPPCDRRSMVNGILYVNKTGCQWRMLPKDYGHWNTVFSTSTLFHLNLRVQPLELGASVVGGELPVDTDLCGVASLGPGSCLAAQRLDVSDAAVEALAGEDA
jgi:hypothetical protein